MSVIDQSLNIASLQVRETRENPLRLEVQTFFDEATFTASHVAYDPLTRRGVILDSVIDFDPASARISTRSADTIASFAESRNLKIDWVLETHAHADHITAASYLQQKLGGKLGIGREIIGVQCVFGEIFNLGADFARDGSQFDTLFADGDSFSVGQFPAVVLHVPGHTQADVAYVIGEAAFIGDTLFMPDYGTARTDFPGGDARQLYHSIRRLLSLPDETRVYLCHDYRGPDRQTFAWETTIGDQRKHNLHAHDGVGEEEFVAMRAARDKTLQLPALIIPAVQVNLRGGRLPPPEDNGRRYLKYPLNTL
jgi:glyoxylase-like metal-dependent hydrolase (beta-lactamase superfamily II)